MTPSYAEAVFAFADELGLADAVRHGEGLTAAQLAAWYEDADVFVCLSEHEGFCIPLLEAMRAGTPIVAFDAGAVAETLGDAGILLPEARPATVAAAVDRVHRDDRLAGVAGGRRPPAAGRLRGRRHPPAVRRGAGGCGRPTERGGGMKLAFVTPRYGTEVIGGAETAARMLAERLCRATGMGGGGPDQLRPRPPHVGEHRAGRDQRCSTG